MIGGSEGLLRGSAMRFQTCPTLYEGACPAIYECAGARTFSVAHRTSKPLQTIMSINPDHVLSRGREMMSGSGSACLELPCSWQTHKIQSIPNPYRFDLFLLPSFKSQKHTMSSSRSLLRLFRSSTILPSTRPLTTTSRLHAEMSDRVHPNVAAHREVQKNSPLTPHMTNTTSTMANEMPSVGVDKASPETLSQVDPDFVPKDAVPENTERMTGGTQGGSPDSGPNKDLGVGEMEGAKFKVEPLRREGEDSNTMKARLLCSSYISADPDSPF